MSIYSAAELLAQEFHEEYTSLSAPILIGVKRQNTWGMVDPKQKQLLINTFHHLTTYIQSWIDSQKPDDSEWPDLSQIAHDCFVQRTLSTATTKEDLQKIATLIQYSQEELEK